MKHLRDTRGRAAFFGVIAVLFIATGCAAIQQPEGWAAPVGLHDGLLVQSDAGQISLVDPASGRVAWTFPDESSRDRTFYATPVVDGDHVLLVDYEGTVTRLRTSSTSFEVDWVLELGDRVVATPIARNGSVFVPTVTGRLVVVDTGSGLVTDEIRTTDRRIWGAPVANSNLLFLGDLDNGATVAIDIASTDVAWEQRISGPTAADLALAGDTLLVGAFDQHLHALDVLTGEERWAFEGVGWFVGRPLVDSDTVYAATMRGNVYALDRSTGNPRWTFTAEDEEFRAAPVVVGNRLVVAARKGRVIALDLESGAVTWEQDTGADGNINADPFVDGSDIYLVTSSHDLVRVDAARDGAFQNVPLAAAQ